MKYRIFQIGRESSRHGRLGFTLTEMLVAVGLLLVIMTIFAQVFQLAVTAMTRQKGLANNDQNARMAFTILDGDLKRMSYRAVQRLGGTKDEGIIPLVPGLLFNGQVAASTQKGYFYYSENDPQSDVDDVLQFTVDTTQINNTPRYKKVPESPYYGRSVELADPGVQNDQPNRDNTLYPLIPDTSVSRYAEVSYFLRNGTLYRRVLLLRDTDGLSVDRGAPIDTEDGASLSKKLVQPGTVVGGNAFDLMRPSLYSGNFYRDFDFSAHHGESPYESGVDVAVFHGSLSNDDPNNWPLGIPHFRFGFNHATGLPREFLASGEFIGRFTHAETSSSNFVYPQSITTGVSPFNAGLVMDGSTGKVSSYSDGNRQGADVLLANVHGFNVEIWDDSINNGVGGFVDINSNVPRDTGASRPGVPVVAHAHENTSYGPTNGTTVVNRNVFDTWHSDFVAVGSLASNPPPPVAPLKVHPQDSDTPSYLGIITAPRWGTGSTVTDFRTKILENRMFVFPSDSTAEYFNFITWRAEWVDPNKTIPNSITLGAEPVEWLPGGTYYGSLDLQASAIQVDYDIDPLVGDGPDVRWVAVDNRKPIRAIRVTIRFLDLTSQQMRQMSLVHSFNN